MKTTSYATALFAALCFSTAALTTVPVNASSSAPSVAVSASASSTTSSDSNVQSQTSDVVEPEADVSQTIEIHQVISKTSTKAASVADTTYTGVNGATWSVYDVTSDLTNLLGEQKDAKDVKTASDQLEATLSKKSYDLAKYTKVTTGKTKSIDRVDGLLDVPVTVKAHEYKALLFQNDAVPDYTTKAEQFVLIVPLADDSGKIPSKMVIRPKSQTIPKPKTKTPTGEFPQTGDRLNWVFSIAGALVLAAIGYFTKLRFSRKSE